MARRKSSTAVEQDAPVVEETIERDLGEFAVTPYLERRYKSIYFGIREMYGLVFKKSNPELDWEALNAQFILCFGEVEEKKHSFDELEEFALEYFNKTLDEIIAFNHKSLNRRSKQSTEPVPKPKLAARTVSEDEIPY